MENHRMQLVIFGTIQMTWPKLKYTIAQRLAPKLLFTLHNRNATTLEKILRDKVFAVVIDRHPLTGALPSHLNFN
ncbi:hypothetical protein FRB94_011940 [Tulasnella sp. JGI-2019a]|nr:hypothetical protein FRB93_008150 [Tulasnella sp. JGI-2019a]KAG8992152.1 hypothetical protein FRB94_011940 [Tulasnella sp. JGI-2019a]KAG9023489.1 hypothetical protein FRB95_012999 [Tulasnella sp. JGI-2019a]